MQESATLVSATVRHCLAFILSIYTDDLVPEREAVRWVKKHIAAFGGDPEKVTMWVTMCSAESPCPAL